MLSIRMVLMNIVKNLLRILMMKLRFSLMFFNLQRNGAIFCLSEKQGMMFY